METLVLTMKMNRNNLLLILMLSIGVHPVFSQEIPVLERKVTINANSKPVQEILETLSLQANVVFSYKSDLIPKNSLASVSATQRPLRLVLSQTLGNSFAYKVKGKYVIIQKNKELKGKPKIIKVEGYIASPQNGQGLKEVSVYNKDHLISAVTDEYGYFKMEIPQRDSSIELQVSKQGYTDTVFQPIQSKSPVVSIEIAEFLDTAKSKFSIDNLVLDLPKWLINNKIQINSLNLTDSIFRKFQFSLFPFLSTNQFLTGKCLNEWSFNATVGYVQSIEMATFAGMVNIISGNARYLQCAGISNIVGSNSYGAQLSGIMNYSSNVSGLQSGGLLNISKTINGIQSAGVLNICNQIKGIQLAGVQNISSSDADIQAAGVGNISGNVSMGQFSGVLNISKICNGIQVSGVSNICVTGEAGQFSGVLDIAYNTPIQVSGVANICSDSSFVQVAGVFNYGKHSGASQISGLMNVGKNTVIQVSPVLNVASLKNYVQIGLINISDTSCGTPVGLLSVVKKGYHKIDVGASEIFLANMSFRTGVKRLHNILQLSVKPAKANNQLWSFAYGLGTTFSAPFNSLVDIDIIAHQFVNGRKYLTNTQLINGSLGFEKRLFGVTSIAMGVTYNLLYSYKDANSSFAQDLVPISTGDSGVNNWIVSSWIGGYLSLRLF